jgi:uncharacterized membrane protein YfcA
MFAIVGAAAFVASALTLYSGFGLGTVLLPVFAVFFPVPVAVAATGAVHLLNNLFKGTLLRRQADWATVARFGLPAVPAAVGGAWLLSRLGSTSRVFDWTAGGRSFGPTAAALTVGALMIVFAFLELQPWFQRLAAPPRLMPIGGLLTGFFGGLTGSQGAFRSMFLLKSGLDPARFVTTGVMIAVLVDLSRLPIYAASFSTAGLNFGRRDLALVVVATACAGAGAYLGIRYVTKATHALVRNVVVVMMVFVGGALMAGLVGS